MPGSRRPILSRFKQRKPKPLWRASKELLNAINGVKPLARRGYVSIPIFFLGWPTSELAPLVLTGSVLDALRRGRRGDFAGWRGKLALAITAASWPLLVLIQRRNVGSEPPMEEALREALGDDYRSVAVQSQPGRRRRGVLRTSLSRRRYVKKADTIRYGPHGAANLADIWHRSDLPLDGRAPVLLQVPGGAWAIGMRRPQSYPLLSRMAERGWICVSIACRVSPRHTWPDHIVDVKRALAWIKDNIADYGGDPDFVAITGGSAGGHLTALAALTPNDPQYQPGFPQADTSVVAAVPLYGRYDWFSTKGLGRPEMMTLLRWIVVRKPLAKRPDIYLDASPMTRLRRDAPPWFTMHGVDDSLIPIGEARDFVKALREVSQSPVAYAELPHAQHAFDFFGSPRGHYSAAAVERFLSWVHATRTGPT